MGEFRNKPAELTQVDTINTEERYRVLLFWDGIGAQEGEEIEVSPLEAFEVLKGLSPEDVLSGNFEIAEGENANIEKKDALWAAHVYVVLRAVGLKDAEARELLNSVLIPERRAYGEPNSDQEKIEEDFKYYMWLITNAWELTHPKDFGKSSVAEAAIWSVGKEDQDRIEIYWNPTPRDVIKTLTRSDLGRILQWQVNPRLERIALLKWQIAFNRLAIESGLASEVQTADSVEDATKVDPNFVYVVTALLNRARQNPELRSKLVPAFERITMSLVNIYRRRVVKGFYDEIDVPLTLREEGLSFYNEHLGNLTTIVRGLTESEGAIDSGNPLYVKYLVYRRLYGAEGIVDVLSNLPICKEKSACLGIDRKLNERLLEVSMNEREELLKQMDQEIRSLNLKVKLDRAKKALATYSGYNWLQFSQNILKETIQGEFPSELLNFITSDMQHRVQGNSIPEKITQSIRNPYSEDGSINEEGAADILALWSLLQFDLLMSPKLAKLFVKINDWYNGLTEDEQSEVLNSVKNKRQELWRLFKKR